MAQGFAAEAVGVIDGTLTPASKFDGRVVGARVRSRRATLDLAAATTKGANGDTNVLFRIPSSERIIALLLTSSVDLGATATIAIGKAGTPAKYKAAATFRTVDTPTLIMLAAAAAAAPLAAYEDVILTVGAAALPGAGTVVIEALTSGR